MIRRSARLVPLSPRTVLAAALTLLAASAPAQTINTVAGGGPSTGPAVQRPVGFAYQVALDATGNRYVATGPLHMVVKIDATGVLTVVAGNGADAVAGDLGPATSASLRSPIGVAVDTTGNVYVSDYFAHTIRRVAAGTGIITTIAGQGFAGGLSSGVPATSATLNSPGHLSYANGFLYVADSQNHAIRRIDLGTGIITTVAGGGVGSPGFADGPAATALFSSPNGVSVDTSGANVYVADTLNHRVRRISGGTVTTLAGTGTSGYNGEGSPATGRQLNSPEGVFVDGAGNVLIADEYNFRIRKLTSGTISTVAGGTSGFAGDGGPALSAAMQRPWSMAVDAGGNLIIGDTFNDRVRRVDAATGFISTIGGNGTTQFGGDGGPATGANLNGPFGVFVDGGGNVYFADETNSRVRRFDVGTGLITTVAGDGVIGFNGDGILATAAHLAQPRSMAMDASGNVFIADTNNNRIRKVDFLTGLISTVAGNGSGGFVDGVPATTGRVNQPCGIAVDGSGNLYIADTQNNRVRKVDVATGLIGTLAGGATAGAVGDGGLATSALLNGPKSVALDAAGNVFIADTGNHRVRRIDRATGIITLVAGGAFGFGGDGGPATSALMRFPAAVAVDAKGNLVVADTDNFRVRLVEARTGRITTVAGNGGTGFLGDGGPATSAVLNKPQGVAVNGAGRVFLSDTFNQRIRAMALGQDLAITKDDAQTSALPGASVTYTLRVTNNGPYTLSSVNVVDTAPPALTITGYSTGGNGTYSSATGDWTLGTPLLPSQSANLAVTAIISSSATGSLTNTATVAPPLGLIDTNAANDQGQDTDLLTPSADLAITKLGPPTGSVGVSLTYTLNVSNNGPSNATSVVVTDVLPAGATFQSASAPCAYSAGTVSCPLGTVAAGSGFAGLTITVMPTLPGTLVNGASVSRFETDPAPANDTSSTTAVIDNSGPDAVRYLAVTAKSTENVLEWLNPAGFGNVRIRYKSDPVLCTFPTAPDGSDGSFPVVDFLAGTPNQPGRYTHAPIANGDQYCYTVWADKGGGAYSGGRFNENRPFPIPAGPGIKWAYNMGSFTMTPPGNGMGAVYAVAQDGSLHSIVKGSGAQAGTWPAPVSGFPLTWIPQSMNAPSQGRPSGIPVATQGSTRTIFLSSQDGHVYAFNADTGAPGWSPSSPLLAPAPHLQAHPAGVFTAFGGTRDLVFVGTRDPAGSRFYALRLLDGNTLAPGWVFNGGAFGKIGAISGQAAVDQQAKRVYFASREFDATNNKTVWCLDLETGAPCSGFAPQAYENVDTGVSLSGGRLFVGSNNATGTNPRVLAIRTSDGGQDWSFPITIAGEGAPKGYVVVDRLSGDSYFSTMTTVWALGAGGTLKWSLPLLLSPSTPVYAPGDAFVYVGTGDGRLRRIRVAGGEDTTAPFPLRLGEGTAAAGSPTFDVPANFMYVGTEDGIVYAVQLP
jgi:uncharacterized repeat protein (TIGR01451 family)